MITGIAWKNVWRNRSRSLIVIAAVTVGVFAGVFSIAVMNSAIVQRIDASVNEELSHIKINNKDFRNSTDINNYIPDIQKVVSSLESVPGVTSITGRIIVRGIASTSTRSAGVEISGIDVEKGERNVHIITKDYSGHR
jgi:ABC-type lipoprotein release transport system permease subunit